MKTQTAAPAATHTPRPWKIVSNEVDWQTEIVGDSRFLNGERIGFTEGNIERAEANAAFIVRAVNSHEALVKALRDALNALEGSSLHSEKYTFEQGQKALADAGEQL